MAETPPRRVAEGMDNDPLGWPARFLARHGRPPRVLHICNIANYAWVNASIMRRHGVDCVVLDPDFYHVVSTPEWLEADIDGAHGDDYFPRWQDVDLGGYRRPEWFINGPSPFVIRELAGRGRGDRAARGAFRALSALYRRAIGAHKGSVSPFRRLMESSNPTSIAVKRAFRRLLLRGEVRAGASTPAPPGPPAEADVPLLPRGVSPELLDDAFGPFDMIVGYSLGSRFAVGAGVKAFASLELGTLRGLPFEDSELGRMARLVYRSSPEVFVTNVDCIEPALELGIPASRITALPHPFDLETAIAYAGQPAPSPLAGDVPYFFCPARHHWKVGNASWLKGNDILIRGAAEAVRNGHDFRLVLIEWGNELDLSRALIAELGLGERVIWLRPMHRRAMWPILAGAIGVIDQFGVPAFGGVGLEAMAFAKPLISRIDGAQLADFFAEPPPMLDAATPEQVAQQMARVLTEPQTRASAGAEGRDWMARHHGVERQLTLQFHAFERLLQALGR